MNTHPHELDLFDLAQGIPFPGQGAAADHVRSCPDCTALVVQFSLVDDPAAAPPMSDPRPAALAAALGASAPTPDRGQLWRAEWDGISLTVLIVRSRPDVLEVVGVTDAAAADPSCVPVRGDLLGYGAAAVAHDVTSLPMRVLDLFLGQVPTETLENVTAALAGGAMSFDAIVDSSDERERALDAARAALNMLQNASWIPLDATGDAIDDVKMLWPAPPVLATALGVLPGDARRIMQGQQPLTDDQRRRLSELAGRPIGSTRPDEDLLWALDHPSVRPLWRARAAAAGRGDDAAFRWETYHDLNFSLAARNTSGGAKREQLLSKVRQVLDGAA